MEEGGRSFESCIFIGDGEEGVRPGGEGEAASGCCAHHCVVPPPCLTMRMALNNHYQAVDTEVVLLKCIGAIRTLYKHKSEYVQ